MNNTYRIQERVAGQTQWMSEPSGDEFTSRKAAEKVMASLESENDDGQAMEYRVVEVAS